MTSGALLSVDDLSVTFPTEDGDVHAVRGVSFDVAAGETVGIVGESGSGKSVCDPGHPPTRARRQGRRARRDSTTPTCSPCRPQAMREIRGARIAMVFQDPLSSLHPQYTVGWQIVEAIRAHETAGRQPVRRRAIALLEEVGIPDPARRVDDYPHQFSGGMRQRVMLAMALALRPELLIADEPTTALDVTVQAQLLDLLARLQREHGTAIVLVTHDLGVVAQVADRVLTMYAGRIVEEATTAELFASPHHPYTRGLLSCIPGATTRGNLAGADRRAAAEHAAPAAGLRVRAALPACRGPLPSGAAARARGERQPPLGVRAAGRRRSGPSRRRRRARRRSLSLRRPREPDGSTAAARRRPRQALPRATEGAVRPGAGDPCRRRCRPGDPPGRDARTRRRVRVGEVDARPPRRRAARSRRPARSSSTAPTWRASAASRCGPCAATCKSCSRIPYGVAQPASACRVDHRRPAGHPRNAEGDDRRPGRGADGARRAQPRAPQPLSRRLLGRSASAHRRGPRPRPRAAADHLRRAGVGARRLRAGADHQPAASACRTSSTSPTSSCPTTSASSSTSPTGWR